MIKGYGSVRFWRYLLGWELAKAPQSLDDVGWLVVRYVCKYWRGIYHWRKEYERKTMLNHLLNDWLRRKFHTAYRDTRMVLPEKEVMVHARDVLVTVCRISSSMYRKRRRGTPFRKFRSQVAWVCRPECKHGHYVKCVRALRAYNSFRRDSYKQYSKLVRRGQIAPLSYVDFLREAAVYWEYNREIHYAKTEGIEIPLSDCPIRAG